MAEFAADTSLPFTGLIATLFLTILGIAITVVVFITQFNTTTTTLINTISSAGSSLLGVGTAAFAEAQSLINSALITIEQSAGSVTNAITNGATKALNTIVTVGETVLNLVVQGFDSILANLQSIAQDLLTLFLNALTPIIFQIYVILEALTQILNVAQAAINLFLSPLSATIAAINGIIVAVENTVNDILCRLKQPPLCCKQGQPLNQCCINGGGSAPSGECPAIGSPCNICMSTVAESVKIV